MAQDFKGFTADELLLLYKFMVMCRENKISSSTRDNRIVEMYPKTRRWDEIIVPEEDFCTKNDDVIFDGEQPAPQDRCLYLAKRSCPALVAFIRALDEAIATGQIEKKDKKVILSIKNDGAMIVDGSISWEKVKSFIKLFI